ncbi:interleukin-17 receptor C [Chanos chanos]|uniref:Interleukin-17 receptor C n=1 Tax=Chanos chanos TaxID=29144 RepID=A0A6J2VLL7_CHACN|nr:interleukin-17 receptor C-like [Chanos chanos]
MKISRWRILINLLFGLSLSPTVLGSLFSCRNITCPQGLTNCVVEDIILPKSNPEGVRNLMVEPLSCCIDNRTCRPCLNISIQFDISSLSSLMPTDGEDDPDGSYEASGMDEEIHSSDLNSQESKHTLCSVTMSLTPAGSTPQYQRIEFTVAPTALKESNNTRWLTLVECADMYFETELQISIGSFHKPVILDKTKNVCSGFSGTHMECDVPKLKVHIDQPKGVISLHPTGLNMCMKQKQGYCRNWTSSNGTIPVHSATPCQCFQVWRNGCLYRSESCPFTNMSELWWNVWSNVSLSVALAKDNRGREVLNWNVTAPCRLEAELWPCQLGAGPGRISCREVEGFRQSIHPNSTWNENRTGPWTSGSFENINPNLPLCVKLKVNGMKGSLGPWCPLETQRRHWSFFILIPLLVLCVAALGIYLLWDPHKGGRGNVLLLHSSDTDPKFRELVCCLGTALVNLGFHVSLDLWKKMELGSLGPGPWLHAQLDHLSSQGGKTLVVLTQSACERAESFCEHWKEKKSTGNHEPSSIHSDVFAAALSHVLSARINGCAGQRFILVHFESHPLFPLWNRQKVLELFGELPFYQLPKDTQGLLAELSVGRQPGARGKWRQIWWLKEASKRVVQALHSLGCGPRGLKPPTLSPDTPICMRIEDKEENVPLQHVSSL